MATPSEDEYIEVDGLPLDTPAWSHENLGAIYNTPGFRGPGRTVAQRQGEQPRPRIVGPRPVDVRLLVFGHTDSDGNPTSTQLQGLRGNLDELKAHLDHSLAVGTVKLRHVLDDGAVREAQAQLTDPLEVSQAGETVRCVANLWLPDGALRDTALVSTSATDAFPLTVPNPGSGDQLDTVITLSGDATSVTLTNGTWGNNTDLTVAVDLSAGDVTVDTDKLTATQGAASVVGSVSHNTDGVMAARWLPLRKNGDNAIEVSHNGTTLTVTVEHYPRWL